jgi:hypothetical protein
MDSLFDISKQQAVLGMIKIGNQTVVDYIVSTLTTILTNVLSDNVPFLYSNTYVNLNNANATPAAVTSLLQTFNISSTLNFTSISNSLFSSLQSGYCSLSNQALTLGTPLSVFDTVTAAFTSIIVGNTPG